MNEPRSPELAQIASNLRGLRCQIGEQQSALDRRLVVQEQKLDRVILLLDGDEAHDGLKTRLVLLEDFRRRCRAGLFALWTLIVGFLTGIGIKVFR